MRKMLLIVGTLLLLASVVFASGDQDSSGATGDRVTLTMFGGQLATVECLDSPCNELTTFYEEKFNVNIEWVAVPQEGKRDKQQLLLASGDYPPIFWNGDFTNADQMRYGGEGVLVPLNPLVSKAPNLEAAFKLKPYFKPAITTPDGNIYSLPHFEECYHCSVAQKAWINTEWLDVLGLDMPTTPDELETVLMAFKNGDPNGNGKQDEIPWTGTGSEWWHAYIYDYLMNAFIYNDGDRFLSMENGKVGFSANQPEWRDGLRYMARLYDKGLMDPQGFTQNDASAQALTNQDPVIVGAYTAGHNRMYPREEDNWQKYRAIPPLRGPSGVQFSGFYPGGVGGGKFAITNKATQEEIDAVWPIVDYSYTQEGTIYQLFGLQENSEGDKWWRWAEPGELGLNGKPAIYLSYPEIWMTNLRHTDWGMELFFWHADLFNGWAANQDITSLEGYERYLVVESDLYIPYVPDETVPQRLYFSSEDNQRLAQFRTEIESYVRQNTAAFITGQKNVEADWDAYVSGFKGLGLADYITLTQKSVDSAK